MFLIEIVLIIEVIPPRDLKMLHFYLAIHSWVWYFLIFIRVCFALSIHYICFISFLFCHLLGSSSLLELSFLHTHRHGVFQPLGVCIEERAAKMPMCTQDLLKKSFMEAFLLGHCTEGHLEVASTFSVFLLGWFSPWQSAQSPYWHHIYQPSLGRRQGFSVGINIFT